MIRKYVIESKDSLPLCCIEDGYYFNYWYGEVLDNKALIKYIDNSIKEKNMWVIKCDLKIYRIIDVGFACEMNGNWNLFDKYKNLISGKKARLINNEIARKKYELELIWE